MARQRKQTASGVTQKGKTGATRRRKATGPRIKTGSQLQVIHFIVQRAVLFIFTPPSPRKDLRSGAGRWKSDLTRSTRVFHQNEQQKNKIKLFGTFVTLVTVAFLLAVSLTIGFDRTLGWFSNNTRVDSTGMQLTMEAKSFDISVMRSYQTPAGLRDAIAQTATAFAADPLLTSEENALAEESYMLKQQLADVVEYLDEPENGGYDVSADITGFSSVSLYCEFHNEYLAAGEEEGLSPGAYGWIGFDIVLKENAAADFVIDFRYVGLDYIKSSRTVLQVDDATLYQLLNGHILLFENRTPHGAISQGYYYDSRIDGSLSVHIDPSDCETVDGRLHKELKVYWIWPLTFTQMAFQYGVDPELAFPAMYNTTADLNEMLGSVKAHPEYYFNFPANSDIPESTLWGDTYRRDYYTKLCNAYNRADQYIGDKARFLVLVADVYEITSTPSPDPGA